VGYVVTAAHCFDLDDPSARAGFTQPERAGFLYREATEVAIAPDWQPNGSFSDLAIFRIERVPEDVQPIPLLSPNEEDITERIPGMLLGFGQGAEMPGRRHRIEGEVFPNLYEERLSFGAENGGGACQGDSGGPMLVDLENGPKLAGAIALTTPPCERDTSIHTQATRVAYYHDFLVGFMDEHAASDAGMPETDAGSAGPDGGAVDGGSGAGDGGTGAHDGGNASTDAGLRPDGAHRADGGPVMDMGSSGGCSVSAGPGRGAVSLCMFVMLTAASVARTRRGRRGAARRRPQA
jgi:hypothetical protein